jgi:glyoxylase-like metal-dependent hydrolase (beta-lactamase superfamily II)
VVGQAGGEHRTEIFIKRSLNTKKPELAAPRLATIVARMNLEDHLGDIVRKARVMANVTVEAAANAAGLSASELAGLEETGASGRKPNLAALGPVIGLNPVKLEGIVGGWLPAVPDLSLWRELRVITTGDGGETVNCYLAWDEVTREAALFDTGFDPEPVFREIQENQLQLRHAFITHGHSDHVACLGAIREKFPKVFLHMDAKDALPQHKNRRNDCVHLGSLRITNRDVPGHADDAVAYLVGNWPEDAPHVAIVGDALFAGSVGRVAGSWEAARARIVQQLLSLPEATLVCPGHGPLTTVAGEKLHNPFF